MILDNVHDYIYILKCKIVATVERVKIKPKTFGLIVFTEFWPRSMRPCRLLTNY